MVIEKNIFVLVEEYQTKDRHHTPDIDGKGYKFLSSDVRDSDNTHSVWINFNKVTHMEEVRHHYLDDKVPKGDAVIYLHVEGCEKVFVFKGDTDELLDLIKDA